MSLNSLCAVIFQFNSIETIHESTTKEIVAFSIFTEFISGTRMEPPGTLFGVFRFSFPFWKEKNKKIEPETVENTAEFRIWNNLEFLGFVFSKICSFYLWCIKSRSIPSNLDRSSEINFSFSLNVPFRCSASGILYGKNRKYRSQPYKKIALL